MLDEDTNKTPGSKFYHWEMKGVPVRIEIGPRDVAQQQAVVVDRMSSTKQIMPWLKLLQSIPQILKKLQADMLEKARERYKKYLV